MVETLSVSVSGPAFSFLLYENVKCEYDQEGFLLGDIVEKETNTITDNDEQVIKIDRVIKVNSTVPCPELNYFYDGAGRVDPKKIRDFLGEQFLKVVAWYKFKHTNTFRLTLREKVIHKELANRIGTTPDLFVCCLLTKNSSPIGSTHLYSQSFLRYYDTSYQMLPMHIINLSDPNNTYKAAEPCSDTFNNIINTLNINKNKLQGFQVTTKIQTALQKHIDQLVLNLTESEECLFALEEEVQELRLQVIKKQMNEEYINSIKNSSDMACENGSGDDLVSFGSPSNSKETSPEPVSKVKPGSKKLQNKNAKHPSDESSVKIEVCSDNTIDKKTMRTSYAQAAQRSKN